MAKRVTSKKSQSISKSSLDLDSFFGKRITSEWFLILEKFIEKRDFKKGDRIINEGDKVTGFYFINSGKIKVVSHFDEEHERILRLSHCGHLLGHRAISASKYPISGIALTDATVTFIPTEIFIKIIKNNPEFAIYVIEFIATDLRQSEERLKVMIHTDVIVRIAIILCMLIDSYGYTEKNKKQLEFTLPRSDMANMAGTSYESVIRTLAKLEDMKLVRLVNKDIEILNEKELRKLAKEKSRF